MESYVDVMESYVNESVRNADVVKGVLEEQIDIFNKFYNLFEGFNEEI